MAHCLRSLMFVLGLLAGVAHADETLVVASTTSTEQSGLFGWILPRFRAVDRRSRCAWRRWAPARRSTSAAAATPTSCSSMTAVAEDQFVAEGYGSYRKDVMYNDFVVVGPGRPGEGRAAGSALNALKGIAASGQPFVSRGDKSGTHAAELRLWGGRHRSQGAGRLQGTAAAWVRRSTYGGDQCLHAVRPGHLVRVQEPPRPRSAVRRRSGACSTPTA